MFSQLGDKLQDIFKDLRGHGTISESNINDALRQVRLALLEADVDFQVAKRILSLALKKNRLAKKCSGALRRASRSLRFFMMN